MITGVSREMGLGYETARQLKDAGYTVIVTARDYNAVKPLAEKLNAIAMSVDITSDESVRELAAAVDNRFGKLNVLINNAGGYYDQGGNVLTTEIDFVKQVLDTNLLGAWRMAKAFVPMLEKSGSGRIVNVSSGAGSYADTVFGLSYNPGNVPAYGISKLALNGLTVKLAKQLEDTAVIVNSVCPGFVATYPGTEEWGARPVAEGAKSIVWAATLPDDGPRGGFYRDGEPLGW